MNECKSSFNATRWHHGHTMRGITGMIPAGLDIISFDSYELVNGSSFAPTPWWLQEPKENKAYTEAVIVPKMHPHQKLMVVPGFYGNDTATAAEHTVQDGRLLAKLEAYWTWIKDDEKMVGLNPYHWVRCFWFASVHYCTVLPVSLLHGCPWRRRIIRTRAPHRRRIARTCATDPFAGLTVSYLVGARRTTRGWLLA